MKDFQDFRNNWLSHEKINEIQERANAEAENFKNDVPSYLSTISASFSLFLLAEYHEWLHQNQESDK